MNKVHLFRPLILAAVSPMIAGAEPDDMIAIRPEIYPQGLYPEVGAVSPGTGGRVPRAAGGFDVLSGLTNVTTFENVASKGDTSDAGFVFRNLRIESDQTNLDDYLEGYYSFDPATQRLQPLKFERAPQLGIYEISEKILMKDVTDPLNFYINPSTPTQFAQGIVHAFQSDTDYHADLLAGQRICMTFGSFGSNRLIRLVMLMEGGSVFFDQRYSIAASNVLIISPVPVLVSGKYRFRLEAVSPAATFGFQSRFFNENGAAISHVSPGNSISVSLPGAVGGYGLPYRKFSIDLIEGQTLNLPSDLDTRSFLIDGRGRIVGGASNAGINVAVTETGKYYIVIQPFDILNTATENYSGSVTVTNSLGFGEWGAAHQLAYGKDRSGDDPDGDGLVNLLEYALGTDPSALGDPPFTQSLTSSAQSLRFRKPTYVTGATITPQFSGDDFRWENAVAVPDGTENGIPFYKATVHRRVSGKGFSRLRVETGP